MDLWYCTNCKILYKENKRCQCGGRIEKSNTIWEWFYLHNGYCYEYEFLYQKQETERKAIQNKQEEERQKIKKLQKEKYKNIGDEDKKNEADIEKFLNSLNLRKKCNSLR